MINKKKKKHDEIELLAKTKLNSIEVVIFKVLINSYNSHNELVSVNNLLMMNRFCDMGDQRNSFLTPLSDNLLAIEAIPK